MSVRNALAPEHDESRRSRREVTLQSLLDDHFPDDHDATRAFLRRALHEPLTELFARPAKHIRGRLVRLAWDLAGGRGVVAPELPLLVELVHAGSLVVDDIEDDATERRGALALHRIHGVPVALNAGNWLYFLPFTLIERLPLSTGTQLAVHRKLSHTLLRCHEGQALDLSVRASEPRRTDVPAIVHATMAGKTGALLELAAHLGALAGGASGAPLQAISVFGRELGVALQMLDDLGSILSPARRAKGLEDVGKSRLTWPWAHLALRLTDDEFAELQDRARQIERGNALPDPLVDDLGRLLGQGARGEVSARLQTVFRELRAAIGPRPALTALQQEIERVERSYG